MLGEIKERPSSAIKQVDVCTFKAIILNLHTSTCKIRGWEGALKGRNEEVILLEDRTVFELLKVIIKAFLF